MDAPTRITELIAIVMRKREAIGRLESEIKTHHAEIQDIIGLVFPPRLIGRAGLTARQKEVLALVQKGLSNKEIGSQLSITERTAKFHVSCLLLFFGKSNRIGLLDISQTALQLVAEKSKQNEN